MNTDQRRPTGAAPARRKVTSGFPCPPTRRSGVQQQKQAPRTATVDVLGEDMVKKFDNGKGGEVPVMDSSSESGSSEEESSEGESSEEELGSSEEEELSEEGDEYGSEETNEGSSSKEEGDKRLSLSSY